MQSSEQNKILRLKMQPPDASGRLHLLYGDMAEPAVLFCTAPILDIGRDYNHAALM